MKKILALLLATLMVFTLVACANKTDETGNGTTNGTQSNYVPSVEKVSEGKPFFVSITNAKGEVKVTANNDANHKKVEDIVSGDKITNKGDKLFLNHIAYVTVEDRWTATYNCDNIGSDASITFAPKDKSANIMNITCKYENVSVSCGGATYDNVTFAQNGTITIKKLTGKLSVSANASRTGDIDIRGNLNKEGDVTIEVLGENKYKVTSTSDISSLNVNYMNSDKELGSFENGESQMLTKMSDKVAREFIITISNNTITIE